MLLLFVVLLNSSDWNLAILGKYSSVPNKRVGWNKSVGGKIMGKLLNMLDGINM